MARKVNGVGIGLRRPFYDGILETRRRLDWLEITPENWVGRGGRRAAQLAAVAERFTVVPHAVSLNIGGPDPLNADFLTQMEALCRTIRAPFFSDHVCYSAVDGVQFHDLFPLPFTKEAVAHVVRRIQTVKRAFKRPFLLENATFYAVMPGAQMDEPTFLREVLQQADVGMVLDVNNIYVNWKNLGIDPIHVLNTLPLERVAYVHVAGHTPRDGMLIDTHIGPVPDGVWALYAQLIKRTGPLPTLVEWDDHIPALDVILDEADRARALQHPVAA